MRDFGDGFVAVLLGAASLMIATGVAFAPVNGYALLLVVTVRGVGVIQSGKLQSKLHYREKPHCTEN